MKALDNIEKLTVSQLKELNSVNGGKYFTRDNMKYFGDTMANFKIKKEVFRTISGDLIFGYELERKKKTKNRPSGHADFFRRDGRKAVISCDYNESGYHFFKGDDIDLVKDLYLCLDNEGLFYQFGLKWIYENLSKRFNKGEDLIAEKAVEVIQVKIREYLKLDKTFSYYGFKVSVQDRKAIAYKFVDYCFNELEIGNSWV